jgi:transposase
LLLRARGSVSWQKVFRATPIGVEGKGMVGMEVMFDRVAGLDVGKDGVTVCVRTPGKGGRRHGETRTFRGMSRSLEVMRDWLLGEGVTIAAMESTSTYWKPPYYCLEDVMEVWLLNASHMKAVPGRKTDLLTELVESSSW